MLAVLSNDVHCGGEVSAWQRSSDRVGGAPTWRSAVHNVWIAVRNTATCGPSAGASHRRRLDVYWGFVRADHSISRAIIAAELCDDIRELIP